MTVTVIDYGMGNLRSVFNKLNAMVTGARLSSTPADILAADALILPGVGHFKKGMMNLKEMGLIDPLEHKVLNEGTPILGICLGMQLFSSFSEEGNVQGLGWIDARTVRFDPERVNNPHFKTPHMGWNTLNISRNNKLLNEVDEGQEFYFCHSYHVECEDEQDIVTRCKYGYEFTSSVQKGNVHGVQFHPEKSHEIGFKMIQNFLSISERVVS